MLCHSLGLWHWLYAYASTVELRLYGWLRPFRTELELVWGRCQRPPQSTILYSFGRQWREYGFRGEPSVHLCRYYVINDVMSREVRAQATQSIGHIGRIRPNTGPALADRGHPSPAPKRRYRLLPVLSSALKRTDRLDCMPRLWSHWPLYYCSLLMPFGLQYSTQVLGEYGLRHWEQIENSFDCMP